MKVLIISMLRPGDFVMHLSLIRAAAKKYPTAEIHVLIQDISKPFTNLLDADVKFHEFPRTQIVNISKDPSYALTAPIHILSNLLSRLKDECFEVVINLTHNTQSAMIAGALGAETSFGLKIQDGKVSGIESEFAKKFNNEFVDSKTYPYHYVQALGLICELTPVLRASERSGKASGKIGFQFFSSDKKKDISTSLARQFVNSAKKMGFTPVVMAAAFELPLLTQAFSQDEIQVLKIGELGSFISGCELVVSVDTLQLQLASELNVPTLALHLGSANAIKTGSRSSLQEALISKAACHPCAHSSNCPYAEHRCEDFTVTEFESALAQLSRKINSTKGKAEPRPQEASLQDSNLINSQNLESL